jgi:hypothetical protein
MQSRRVRALPLGYALIRLLLRKSHPRIKSEDRLFSREREKESAPYFFAFAAPTVWSQILKAATIEALSSGVSIGAPAIHSS